MGDAVGEDVGDVVGDAVGETVGEAVGEAVGVAVGWGTTTALGGRRYYIFMTFDQRLLAPPRTARTWTK